MKTLLWEGILLVSPKGGVPTGKVSKKKGNRSDFMYQLDLCKFEKHGWDSCSLFVTSLKDNIQHFTSLANHRSI